MRVQWSARDQHGYYCCLARDRGYKQCPQSIVSDRLIDQQVVEALSDLAIPDGFRERVETAVRSRVEHQTALNRMEEIQAIVKRIDFSWEQGFLSPQDYVEKRAQLQRELESLRPVDYDSLMEAADLIQHFKQYWAECDQVDHPEEARQQLMAKIVDRVFVYDKAVVAATLHSDFGIVLDTLQSAPAAIADAVSASIGEKRGATRTATGCAQDGADGDGHLSREPMLLPRKDHRAIVFSLLAGMRQAHRPIPDSPL
jgi:hypothetical protein